MGFLYNRAKHPPLKAENAMNVVALSGWLCFVMVDVYYEGALTMYFATDKDLPFNSIEVTNYAVCL